MDILVFGGKNILKNFTVSSHKKIQEINLDKFKSDTNLTQDMIIDISILMGCDYCSGAYGLGPIKAYELIKKYGSIENVVKNTHIEINTDYKFVRDYFTKPNVIKCDDLTKFGSFKKCDLDKLTKFLNKWNFKAEYINKVCKVCC
jgi:flap endonuclease-1